MKRYLVFCGVGVLVLCVAAGTIAFFQVGYFLEPPSQQPEKADLIVPLGGGSSNRVHKAAELYEQGLAPNVLLIGAGSNDAHTRPHSSDWRIRFLLEHGVPDNMLRLMRERNWRRVLVVSDPPHLRRLAWAWEKSSWAVGKNTDCWLPRGKAGIPADDGRTTLQRALS